VVAQKSEFEGCGMIGESQKLIMKKFAMFIGNYIIIPSNCKEALEHFQEFRQYTSERSKDFLQFAERHLSLNKSDPANNPSFKSCLLRVPYTFNSKCIEEGMEDAEVKMVQPWDSSQPLPEIDNTGALFCKCAKSY
jgi:hypothetical protein